MNRRHFIKMAASVVAAGAVARTWGAETDNKIVLGVPLTHSDWMLKKGIAWGPAGVQHMLDQCKAAGWSQVYWRVLDGGLAMYPSKVVRPGDKWDTDSFWSPQTEEDKKLAERFFGGQSKAQRDALLAKFTGMDYSKFDALGEAVRYGKQIGLKIHAWVSINEDDHGWGLRSDFSRAHEDWRWVKRDGTPYRSQMSFAFEGVREYKLAIIRELLANYEIAGLFLDWIRTGDVRDNPQTDAEGVANSGYETPNVEAFKKEFGLDASAVANGDPRWVEVRSRPQTVFMRQVKSLVNGKIPVCAMVAHPWHYRGFGDKIDGSLRGLLLDVAAWAKEGLIDSAIAAGYYRDGGNAETAYNALKKETGGKTDVWIFGWVPNSVADFDRDYQLTRKVGAKELLLWEADYIDDRPNQAELKSAMKSKSRE